MVSTNSLSPGTPIFTFNTLKRSDSLIFSCTSSGVPLLMVYEVGWILSKFNPQILYQGCPIILPNKSCKAMSMEALAARLAGATESTYERISSMRNGSVNCSKSKEDKNLVTLSTLSPKYGGIEASP